MRWHLPACFVFLLGSALAQGGTSLDARYDKVLVEPVRTSIYVGHVNLSAPAFVRTNGGYTSSYRATVFPFFFWNEHGQLTIEASDDDLRRLEHGETVEFHGHAENSEGETRRVEGRAVPRDATQGTLKIRIFVSRRIELIFNTNYRFVGGP